MTDRQVRRVPQYVRLRERLRRMAESPHFITGRSDKAAIGEAERVIGRLVDRLEKNAPVLREQGEGENQNHLSGED